MKPMSIKSWVELLGLQGSEKVKDSQVKLRSTRKGYSEKEQDFLSFWYKVECTLPKNSLIKFVNKQAKKTSNQNVKYPFLKSKKHLDKKQTWYLCWWVQSCFGSVSANSSWVFFSFSFFCPSLHSMAMKHRSENCADRFCKFVNTAIEESIHFYEPLCFLTSFSWMSQQ